MCLVLYFWPKISVYFTYIFMFLCSVSQNLIIYFPRNWSLFQFKLRHYFKLHIKWYARACVLLTHEQQRITGENAKKKKKLLQFLTDISVVTLPSLVTNNVHYVSYIGERKLKFLLLLYRFGDKKKYILRFGRHITCIKELRNVYRYLITKPEQERPGERPMHRFDNDMT